jgi:hypothetical protein
MSEINAGLASQDTPYDGPTQVIIRLKLHLHWILRVARPPCNALAESRRWISRLGKVSPLLCLGPQILVHSGLMCQVICDGAVYIFKRN